MSQLPQEAGYVKNSRRMLWKLSESLRKEPLFSAGISKEGCRGSSIETEPQTRGRILTAGFGEEKGIPRTH